MANMPLMSNIEKVTNGSPPGKSELISAEIDTKPIASTPMANTSSSQKGMNSSYQVPKQLLMEIARAITNIRGWGSVEIFIQNHRVTQITERNISKTDAKLIAEE